MRFGLIGTGYWARVTHAAGLQEHPECELAGVWGRSADKTRALAEELGVRPYASVDELIADVPAVALAVPPDVQAEVATRAAAAGRHLLLDKPIALDLAAADRLVAAVEESGVRAAVFFTLRYTDNVAEWLAGLRPDGWFAGRVRSYSSIFEPGSPYAGSAWRREHGALWDIAPHALSLALPILGAAEAVVAQHGPADAVDVGIRHHSGATSVLSLSLAAPAGARGSDWQFFGAEETVVMPEPASSPVQALAACAGDLVAAVHEGREPRCDVRFGREVVRVIAEAERRLR